MRHIDKQEPEFYTQFIKSNKPKHWDDFSIGAELRKHMLDNEQNWQCAYTEIRINEKRKPSHIDHFKRKHGSLYPELIFDYNNLFTADSSDDYGARYKDNEVKTKDDYNDLLNPTDLVISKSFKYNLSNGEIEGITDKAKHTIKIFNLNQVDLKRRRLDRIKQMEDYKNIYSIQESLEFIGEFESLIRYIYTVK